MSGKKYDWDKIEKEYVFGDKSMNQLADEYGISRAYMHNAGKRKQFTAKRTKYRARVEKRATTKLVRDAAKKVEREYHKELQLVEAMLGLSAESMTRRIKQMQSNPGELGLTDKEARLYAVSGIQTKRRLLGDDQEEQQRNQIVVVFENEYDPLLGRGDEIIDVEIDGDGYQSDRGRVPSSSRRSSDQEEVPLFPLPDERENDDE